MIIAKVVADSLSQAGTRITSLQLMYPRLIHAEFLTHRVFSRNSSSSRAIPVAKVIAQVRDNPAMPIHWGANQPGMQARAEVEDIEEAKRLWVLAANDAANRAQQMLNLGLHKQVANRILEPFQFMHTIVTATDWANFMELRDHEDADPNIQALAVAMKKVMSASKPVVLMPGSWHLPYVREDENLPIDVACKVSAARCARVSYLTHDGATPDVNKDLYLFDRLAGGRPLHASPLEHQATPYAGAYGTTGNFTGWTQFRKLWEQTL
jgi:thymidylate synthase ThyX